MIALIRKAAPTVAKIAAAPFISFGRGAIAGGAITWLLHGLLVVAVLYGLQRLNAYLELEKVVRAPSSLLRETWLPILFLLAYALGWAALATWRAATRPEAASRFPELDRCWRQVVAAMHRHGVDLAEKPLVLMLGEPGGREAELLSSFAVAPTFGPAPAQPHAKLRVFADDQAIYLLCHESSLLSTAAERLSHVRGVKRRASQPFETIASTEQRMPAALRTPAMAAAGEPTGRDFAAVDDSQSPVGCSDDATTLTLAEQLDAQQASPCGTPALFDDEQAERCAAELDHLVRLIKNERGTVAAINGVVALTPVDAADSDATADAFGWALEQDLAVLGDAAGVRVPVLSIVNDLQHAPGCGHLLHVLPPDRKSKRLGIEVDPRAAAQDGAAEDTIGELLDRMTPVLCQRLMQVDDDPASDDSLGDNAALFELQSYLSERRDRLAKLLHEGLRSNPTQPWPLHGCFLVATGDALGASQAFGSGVLQSLATRRATACWTTEALDQDARYTRVAGLGYAGLTAASVAVGWLLIG
ncbi:hypothetical protein KOR34_14370 [Posidoniimonas corsicana]|uniref:Type VI secretion system component TssM1 N-terminal domain-containing protein n=1 Tax=Posidoniimonas corsicana TaxID=1938618 RepID=A0A5C5VEF6_9BACT|nr:type VI secretion protein IcmF/TssM N-terminal domain-containing protein [Posidoniimonas corsicana]TWT36531.1 hypothetical protein KOR34_14370 [Posidoniimonas corsicana]